MIISFIRCLLRSSILFCVMRLMIKITSVLRHCCGLFCPFCLVHSMRLDSMKELLDKFGEMDTNKDGLVDLKEFADYLNLPVTAHVKHLFTLYDRVRLSGKEKDRNIY